uniref:Reverse transcriptase Ty1/copia-type domain-containing protein n=1 Tax=Tanacetum cinerariifolium TaxID=118510 RepID=A0A6L2J686_TANCI|nr:hypothetical protein [Tanacetum cinerariifolium]
MILESVENGPLISPSIEENGVTRPNKYSELSVTKAIQADYDVKATNIILQGLALEERECKLYDEFDKFSYKNGETLQAQPTQIVSNHNAAYQANDLDAYDSDCYEINTTKVALVANISHHGLDDLAENSVNSPEPTPSNRPAKGEVLKELPKVSVSQEKGMVIKKLKERIKYLSGNIKDDKIKKELEEIETIYIELDHKVTKLIAENEHLKQICKQLYDLIKSLRIRSKEQCDDLVNQVNLKSVKNFDFNASLREKVLVITALKDNLRKLNGKVVVDEAIISHPIDPKMHKFDVAPLAPKLRNNRTVHSNYIRHTQEETATLREIVKQERSLNPLNTSLDYAFKLGMLISRVYFVDGLGHNLFSVRAINHLARQGLVWGLPKLKFENDHLCSACAMGKSKKKYYKPKSKDTNQEKLYLLHMDLSEPMHVKSVNGKKRIIKNIHVDFDELTIMASEQSSSGPALHDMTPVTISSLFDELLTPPPSVDHLAPEFIALIADVVTLEPAASTSSPSSITVDQDAPSLSNSRTTIEPQSSIIPNNTYNDAITQSYWIGEMQEELNEFECLEVWELIPRPDKVMVITLKWIYKVKLDELGGILKDKARLVARGYCQEEGINFEESFALYQAWPTEKHLHAVKRIFRYLRVTINQGLWYPKDSLVALIAFADTDHAGYQDTHRSTSGSMQFLGDRLVSWSEKRSKHIDIKYHFIKEYVENGVIKLYFVNTEYQLADIFTKALGRERTEFLINKLGMRSFTSKTLQQLTDEVDE